MAKVRNVAFEPVGPVLFDGTTSVQEWKQLAVLPDGNKVMMVQGTSVRRFSDGWLGYAADYFDAASLSDPGILAASRAAGSTITLADILKYRNTSSRLTHRIESIGLSDPSMCKFASFQ